MAFLATIKKRKAKEKEIEPVYVPFAEYARSSATTLSATPPDNDTDDTKKTCQDNDDNDSKDNQQTSKRFQSCASVIDIHMRLKELKMVPGDILVLSGDFTNKGTLEEAKIVNEWLGTIQKQQGYKHIVVYEL
eukprot:299285_1